jgi:hypothetical protein
MSRTKLLAELFILPAELSLQLDRIGLQLAEMLCNLLQSCFQTGEVIPYPTELFPCSSIKMAELFYKTLNIHICGISFP